MFLSNDVSAKFLFNFGPSQYLCAELVPTLMYSVSLTFTNLYVELQLIVKNCRRKSN